MIARVRYPVFLAVGLVIAFALALLVSPEASSQPDGLNKVAIDQGFAEHEAPHALGDLPTAGYALRGVDDERWSTGLAGVLGVAVTFGLAAGGTFLLRRRSRSATSNRP